MPEGRASVSSPEEPGVGEVAPLPVGVQTGAAALEDRTESPSVKTTSSYGPATPLLGIYPKDADTMA